MDLVPLIDVANRTGISAKSLRDRRYLQRIGLSPVKVGSRLYFRKKDLERLIAKSIQKLPLQV